VPRLVGINQTTTGGVEKLESRHQRSIPPETAARETHGRGSVVSNRRRFFGGRAGARPAVAV
jgi:hypothetical protein